MWGKNIHLNEAAAKPNINIKIISAKKKKQGISLLTAVLWLIVKVRDIRRRENSCGLKDRRIMRKSDKKGI